jgi:hypothetical protein
MSNPGPLIKRIAIVLIFFIGSFPALAQQNWYVFIQAEDNQPFYARMAGKVYSSSDIGYLVIPGLGDSVYDLVIGFPKKQMSEQRFSVPINKKDHGYELKNNGGAWSLFNWQTQESITPIPPEKKDNVYYGERKTNDPFSEMMAAVVNDSAVLYRSVLYEEKPKLAKKPAAPPDSSVAFKEPVTKPKEDKKPIDEASDSLSKQPIVNPTEKVKTIDSSISPNLYVKDTTQKKVFIPEQKKDSVVTNVVKIIPEKKKASGGISFENPMIVKLHDFTFKSYRKIVYTDATGEKIDTITIFIPFDEPKPQGPKQPVVRVDSTAQKKKDSTLTSTINPKKDSIIASKKDTITGTPVEPAKPDTSKSSTNPPAKKSIEMVNSNCHNIATDNDIDKLRVKMIEASNLDGKLNAAKKLFKTKCLTAREIRALSELFTSDEDKLSFFEVCYPFADDTDNFKQLYILLTDKSIIARFKTMVHLQ